MNTLTASPIHHSVSQVQDLVLLRSLSTFQTGLIMKRFNLLDVR